MKQLAAIIRERRDSLAAEYDQRLQAMQEYAQLAEGAGLDLARQELDALAACLEAGDAALFLQLFETRAQEWLERGLGFQALQQALMRLEETLWPILPDLETARFLWRVLAQAAQQAARRPEATLREQELRAARQQLADIIDFLPDATFVIDRAGRVTAWNRAMEELVQVAARDMLGKGDYEYALPFYGERRPLLIDLALKPDPAAEHKYAAIQRRGDKVIGESYIPNLRGLGERYFVGVAAALRDAGGEIIGAIESIRDITAHKRVEDELRQRLRELEIITSISQTLVSQAEPQALVESIGEKIRQAFDVQVAFIALLDQQTNMLHFPYYFDGERQPTEPLPFGQGMTSRIMQLGQPVVINQDWVRRAAEYGAVYHDGRPAQASVGVPIIVGDHAIGVISLQSMERENAFSDADVRLLTAIAANVGVALENARLYTLVQQELAERKRTEERLRLESAALESAANAIVITDCQGRIVWVNPAFTQLTGYTLEEALDQNPRVLKSGQHDADFYRNMWQTILAGDVWRGEIINQRKDSSLYTEEMTITPVRDQRGDITHFVAIKQDVTRRKQLEQHLQELLERRGRQVQTSTEVAQEIAAAPALNELFRRVVTLVKEQFGYYHTQIFRYEPALDAVILVAGYGEAGQKMLARGHRLPMGRGVVGTAAATGQAVLASDVRQEKDWRPNPDLPQTQGELAVPIKLREQVMGILDVQSDQAGALTQEDQLMLEGLCGQIAIAIESTRLRQDMEEKLQELDMLYRAASHESWEAFRKSQRARLPGGYLFDRAEIQPADDLWTPAIGLAAEQNTFVAPAPPAGTEQAPERLQDNAAAAPLTIRGEVIGVMGVQEDPQQPMSADDLELVRSVSEQVTLALENARLIEQTQAALAESQALYQASADLNAAQTYEEILEALRKHTLVGQADLSVSIHLFDKPWTGDQTPRWANSAARWSAAPLPFPSRYDLEQFPAIRLLKPDAPYVFEDIETHPLLDDNTRRLWRDTFHARSMIFIPLTVGGQLIGYIPAMWSYPNQFAESDTHRAMALSNQAAVAIQSIRQLEETRQRAQREQVLRQITATINASQDLAASLPEIKQLLARLAPLDTLTLAMYTPGEREFTLFAAQVESQTSAFGQIVQPGIRRPLEKTGPGWVITHGQPRLDANFDEDFVSNFTEGAAMVAEGLAARLLLPLRLGEQIVGTLNLGSTQPGAYTEDHIALLQPVADQVALALERARLLEETRVALDQVQATHRRYLREEWETFLESAAGRTIGYLDGPTGLLPLEQHKDTGPLHGQAGNAIAVPIKVRGEPIGAMEFYAQDATHAWSEQDQALVEALADQAALALENARLFEETQSRAQREHMIADITAKIRASTDMGVILRTTVEELTKALSLSRARVRLGASGQDTESRQTSE